MDCEESNLREVISKVQTMRKEAGFEVTDHIRVTLSGSEKLAALAGKYSADLCAATLCDQLVMAEAAGYTKAWDINGEAVTLGVEKL